MRLVSFSAKSLASFAVKSKPPSRFNVTRGLINQPIIGATRGEPEPSLCRDDQHAESIALGRLRFQGPARSVCLKSRVDEQDHNYARVVDIKEFLAETVAPQITTMSGLPKWRSGCAEIFAPARSFGMDLGEPVELSKVDEQHEGQGIPVIDTSAASAEGSGLQETVHLSTTHTRQDQYRGPAYQPCRHWSHTHNSSSCLGSGASDGPTTGQRGTTISLHCHWRSPLLMHTTWTNRPADRTSPSCPCNR